MAPRTQFSGGGFSGGLGFPPLYEVTKRLLLVLAGVWLLLYALTLTGNGRVANWILGALALQPSQWFSNPPYLPIWQVFTYGLVHSESPWHLIGNALYIYFFGSLVIGRVGERRMLSLLVAGTVVGGVGSLAWKLATGSDAYTVGISAGALALVTAAAVFEPRATVIAVFIPIPLFVLALILVGLDAFGALNQMAAVRSSSVDHFAHLFGAGFGFLAARRGWVYFDPAAELDRRRAIRARQQKASDEQRLDQLLARINAEGISALSDEEREFLKKMSRSGRS